MDLIAVARLGLAPDVLELALTFLRARRLLIYPTDTLYALGGRAMDSAAAAAVREAKGRGDDQPLPLVAADVAQARSLVSAWPDAADLLAKRFWPGPLTLVLPAAAGVPEGVTSGTGTVAVRVPAAPVACELAAGAGPLISTSANRTGQRPPLSCAEAVEAVGAAAALALDAGPGRAQPSTIVDLTAAAPRLARAGAIDWAQVRAVLG